MRRPALVIAAPSQRFGSAVIDRRAWVLATREEARSVCQPMLSMFRLWVIGTI
jgi:uncharacterized protein (DUF2342 family)